LSAEVARSREAVERDLHDLRAELDIPRKIRRSFRSQTGLWIAAAAVIGIALAVRSSCKKKVYVETKAPRKTKGRLLEAGFALGVLRIAATFLKPVVVKFVTEKIRDYAGSPQSAGKW
jgi:hypothetical protein